MATFGVQVTGVEKVLKRMQDLPGKLDEAEKRAVLRGQAHMLRAWKNNARSLIKVRTSAYINSIGINPAVKLTNGWEGRVGIIRGKAEKYAATHEGMVTGSQSDVESQNTFTVIRAKGKVLAIPFGPNKNADGTARYASSPRDARAWGGFWMTTQHSKGGSDKLFFWVPTAGSRGTNKPGRAKPGEDKSKQFGLEPWFIGVPEVRIPARRPMGRAFKTIRPMILEDFESFTRKALGGA